MAFAWALAWPGGCVAKSGNPAIPGAMPESKVVVAGGGGRTG